jgi:hypothetical protein
MAVTASDILIKYSTTAGTAGSSQASTPAASLGKYISTTDVPAGANTQFDDVSATENAGGVTDYRCLFVLNNHASLPMVNAVVFLAAEVTSGANVAIGVDSTAISAKAATSAQAGTIASETVAPSTVSAFSSPTSAVAGLLLGTIPAGSCKAVWVRRTAANTAALSADGYTLGVTCDTDA